MNPAFVLPPLPNLPILAALPALRAALATNSRVVLEAPPGAGKTTVVPLELLAAEWRGLKVPGHVDEVLAAVKEITRKAA